MTPGHADCLNRHVPPPTNEEPLRTGLFYRCAGSKEIKARYQNSNNPVWGDRIRLDKIIWPHSTDDLDGLSVTSAKCATCPECAVELLGDAHRRHVIAIHLGPLRDVVGDVVAVHDPVDTPRANPCHYLLVPLSADIADVRTALQEFMHKDFPEYFPTKPDEIADHEAARERYEAVFEIHRDVLKAATSDGHSPVGHSAPRQTDAPLPAVFARERAGDDEQADGGAGGHGVLPRPVPRHQ